MANFYTAPTGVRINTAGFTPRAVNRLGRITTNQGLKAGQTYANQYRTTKIPKVSPPLTTPTETTPPAVNPIPAQNYSNIANAQTPSSIPTDQNSLNTVFPNERMFEPQNYQGSPLYQFQVKAGEDQLAKSLAAKGLTNSGAAIRQELNIPMMAAAQDTDRIQQNANNNANRLQTYQTNEADRLERASNNQWGRYMDIANLMAAQSPWEAAIGGLNNYGNTKDAAGQANAKYLADAYRRIIASGGGGKGFVPMPVPSGPDYSNIGLQQIVGNAQSSNAWTNILSQGLGYLLGGK